MGFRQRTLDRVRMNVMGRALAYGLSDEAPEWWGELHSKARARLSSRGQRISDITEDWKIINDFLSIGLIVAIASPKNSKDVCWYRLARPGDRLHKLTEVHHATTLSDD